MADVMQSLVDFLIFFLFWITLLKLIFTMSACDADTLL